MIVTEGRLPVVVTGLPQHRSRASGLLRGFPDTWVKDLVGMTTLDQMLGCLAGARFALANDGGSLHLAQLVGTPAVVAFGPTAPEQRLLNFSLDLTPLRLGISCSPCMDTAHRYQCPSGYLQCLRGLVAAEAREVLLQACRAPIRRAS
jgi:ADP-heptose:LPS heptosyltransferase